MTIINNAPSLEVVGAPAIDPAVLEDARALGIAPDSVLATEVLDGGRGRRAWRVRTASADFVLRRRQFLGDEDVATTVAASLGVGPEVVSSHVASGLILTKWLDGSVPTAPQLRESFLPELAQALLKLHSVTSIHGQPVTEVVSGIDPLMTRADYLATIKGHSEIPQWVRAVLEMDELDVIAHQLGRISATQPMVLIHGDPVPGNIVTTPRGVKFVDFEYAGAGNAWYEVGHAVAALNLSHEEIIEFSCHYADVAAAPAIEGWSYLAAQAWAVWVAMAKDPGAHSPIWQEWAQLATRRLLDARAGGDFERVLAELS
jgi:thiamine kinase-like enzyme